MEMRQNARMQIAPFRSLLLLKWGCLDLDSSLEVEDRPVRDVVVR